MIGMIGKMNNMEKIIFSRQVFESDKVSKLVIGAYTRPMNMMKIMNFFDFLAEAKCKCGKTRWMMARCQLPDDETGTYERLITFCKNCRSRHHGIVKDKKIIYFRSERE